MCFCCATCGASILLKRACPGNGCITWFILSMLFSIVVFALLIAFQVYLDNGDGSFPIDGYKSFTGVLITGNVFSFIACIMALVLVFLNKKSLPLSILCELLFVFGFCVTLYCIYYVSHEKPSVRVSKFTKEFYRRNKQAPPFLEFVQSKAKVTIPIPRNPETLGCCGSLSFEDYANSSKRLDRTRNDFIFDVPDSCCKVATRNCGRNLRYSHHFTEVGFLEEAIAFATGGSNKNLTITQNLDRILARHRADLRRIERQAEEERKKPRPRKNFISLIQNFQHLLTGEQIQNLKQLPDLILAVQNRSSELADFQKNRVEFVKINVIGCGRVFDAVCSGCVTAFVVVQAIVNLFAILAYIYYYRRLGRPLPV